jgi:DNA uptake protein ComE-like DNA-binding protein
MKATTGYLGVAAACAVTMLVSGASAATDAPTRTSPQTATAAPGPPHPVIGAPAPAAGAGPATKGKAAPVRKVDINNASLAELRSLPVGEAEAKKIIAHRPYRSKGELMTKAGLPEGVYHAVKRKVELQAPRRAVAKK